MTNAYQMKLPVIKQLLVLSAVLACYSSSVTSGSKAMIAITLESKANTLDGCVSCGCRLNGELQPGNTEQWWLAFGLLQADSEQQWQTVAPANYCGRGPFEAIQSDFEQTVGLPYAVLDLTTTAATRSGDEVSLDVHLKHRRLSGFDPDGLPRYTQSEDKRSYSFQSQTDITLPLLIANDPDLERLGVHEVLVRLRATLLGVQAARSYGSILVQTDVPGAQVMLDGGFAGRSTQSPPLLLTHVPAGITQVRVRDFSGREAKHQVTVKPGETAQVVLDVLKLSENVGPPTGLTPIGKNPQGYQEYWRAKDSAMVVDIPAGEFLMGSPEGEAHEQPLHPVYLSGFLMDKTEVTWRQFKTFAAATGSGPATAPIWGTPDNIPVSMINWHKAQGYCQWIGGRLPTEAEWEKAARGTDGRTYQWGKEWDPRRCNAISGGTHRPENAGSFPNCYSPYGVLDMAGSMWEWALDWYQPDYYAQSVSRDPMGPPTGDLNVVRGGGWMTQPHWLRASYRFRLPPRSRRPDLGFRCVLESPEQRR